MSIVWNSLIIVGVLVLLSWVVWALVKKFRPSVGQTTAGQKIEAAIDKTQDWTAMGALRVIRWMDEVEDNPAALVAWEALYAAIGGTPTHKPEPVVTQQEAATIPVVKTATGVQRFTFR